MFRAMMILALLTSSIQSAVSLDVTPANLEDLVTSQKIVVHGTVAHNAQDGIGSFDFAPGGFLEVRDFSFPRPAFTVEALFLANEYSGIDPYISTVVGSFYWTASSSQGIDFRVGGGNQYPLLPSEAYSSASDFVRPDGVTRLERAYLSRSIGDFVLGGQNGAGGWKEIYSTEGIARGEWTHMVGVWNGSTMELYINGRRVTDTWRINGAQITANIDPLLNLFIGACCSSGARHFNGRVAFVRIHDSALEGDEIRDRYASLFSMPCQCRIHVQSPLSGQGITDSTRFHLKLDTTLACGNVPDAVDSIEVSLFGGIDFDKEVFRVNTGKFTFSLKELIPPGTEIPHGVIHVKVSCKAPMARAKSLATIATPVRSSMVPVYSLAGTTTRYSYFPMHSPAAIGRRGDAFDVHGRRVLSGKTGINAPGVRIDRDLRTGRLIRTIISR